MLQTYAGRKFRALVLIAAGAFVWFFNDSDVKPAHDILTGIGVFIFLMGFMHLGVFKSWANLSPEEKKKKMLVLTVVIAVAVLGMIFFF